MHWWNGYDHMGWNHTGWMGIWWLVGALLVAGVVWALFRAARLPASGPGEPPVDVVKRRYAKGEIDRQTYERMLHDLKG